MSNGFLVLTKKTKHSERVSRSQIKRILHSFFLSQFNPIPFLHQSGSVQEKDSLYFDFDFFAGTI